MTTFYDVKINSENGKYTAEIYKPDIWGKDFVIDDNLTIKENRNRIIKHNELEYEKQRASMKAADEALRDFHCDMIDAICSEFKFNKRVATVIHDYVYEEKHEFVCDYLDSIECICDLVNECIEAYKNECIEACKQGER